MSFLPHENRSGVYIGKGKQSAFTSGRTVPGLKARKSQIKCEATRGPNIARTSKIKEKKNKNNRGDTFPSPNADVMDRKQPDEASVHES